MLNNLTVTRSIKEKELAYNKLDRFNLKVLKKQREKFNLSSELKTAKTYFNNYIESFVQVVRTSVSVSTHLIMLILNNQRISRFCLE
ncbi:unnamed protein product [Paramecium sonneborni]|uniref:Uncharacterized protein n=1 Tax=Paramecium sonneborni TaxID=65129 RepID=A0A8S1NHQ5_9CILI|nr:unnamed protein product [Paramecium sonneborni]